MIGVIYYMGNRFKSSPADLGADFLEKFLEVPTLRTYHNPLLLIFYSIKEF